MGVVVQLKVIMAEHDIPGNGWTDAILASLLGAGAFAIGKGRASKKLLQEFHGGEKYKNLAEKLIKARKAEAEAAFKESELGKKIEDKWRDLIPDAELYRGTGIYERAPRVFKKDELTHPIDVLKNKENIHLLHPVDNGVARYRREAIPDLEEVAELKKDWGKKFRELRDAEKGMAELEGSVLPEIASKAKKTGLIAGGITGAGTGATLLGLHLYGDK